MILRAGLFMLGLMATVALAAGILFHYTGVLVVDVQDKVHDHHIYAPVPMLLVRGAIRAFPSQARFHMSDRITRNADMINAMAQALEDCPDGNFVEVSSPRENVVVRKAGGNFYVDVSSEREEVHLQVPIAATGSMLADLAVHQ